MINIFHGLTFFVASGKVLYSFCFKARNLVGVVGVMEWVGGGGRERAQFTKSRFQLAGRRDVCGTLTTNT